MNKKSIIISFFLYILIISFLSPVMIAEEDKSSSIPWKMSGLLGKLEFSGYTEDFGLGFYIPLKNDVIFGGGAKMRFGETGEIINHKTGDHYDGKFAINILFFIGIFDYEQPVYFNGTAILYQAGGT